MDWGVVNNVMRDVVGVLQTPVVACLLVMLALALVFVGVAIVEWVAERRHLKATVPELADRIQEASGPEQLAYTIEESGLLASQKRVLSEVASHPGLTDQQREAMAVNLLEKEQSKYELRLTWTNLIAKIAPMFGLMGTLIPLGPGLIALGQGDTQTLSASLLIAFDTTVIGLITGAIAMVVSTARKRWYGDYQSMLEALEECVLEAVKSNARA